MINPKEYISARQNDYLLSGVVKHSYGLGQRQSTSKSALSVSKSDDCSNWR